MSLSRVVRSQIRPDQVFEPVAEIIASQPAELARLEWAIADAFYMESQERGSGISWTNAKRICDVIYKQLNEIDRASLQLHPWWRMIQQGLSKAEQEFA